MRDAPPIIHYFRDLFHRSGHKSQGGWDGMGWGHKQSTIWGRKTITIRSTLHKNTIQQQATNTSKIFVQKARYLEEVRASPVQHPWTTLGQRRRVERVHPLSASLHPHKLDVSGIHVSNERVEHSDSVGPSAYTGDHVVRELPRHLNNLCAVR